MDFKSFKLDGMVSFSVANSFEIPTTKGSNRHMRTPMREECNIGSRIMRDNVRSLARDAT